MMAKRGVLVGIACAVVAAVVLVVTLLRPSEEDRVKKTLDRFAKVVAVKSDDNVLARAGRLRSGLAEIVDNDVRVDVPDLAMRFTGRDKLVEGAMKAALLYSSADCQLTSVSVVIDESATTAKADALAIVTGIRGGERKLDRRNVHFLLRKDGDWRITTIDVASPTAE